jgi:hypothetical protein
MSKVRDSRQDLRTIVVTNLSEQTQDLGKSINVYNNNPNVSNPFVQNHNSQVATSRQPSGPIEIPATPCNPVNEE